MRITFIAGTIALLAAFTAPTAGRAQEVEAPPTQTWAVHGQTTFVAQANAAFRAPYGGANSLNPSATGRETWDVTFYAGLRPWSGAEIWVNPEIDQGFGLSNTLGVAGFPSGEAYKVGKASPYVRLQRLFIRQTIGLGGKVEAVEPDLNQLGGAQTSDRLVLTAGKVSVGDVFDTNRYAHDPRRDFLNWAVIDAGTFDYAADAWGYTYGVTSELYRGPWAVRLGVFNLSNVPNSTKLGTNFSQFQLVGEIERRYALAGHAGKLKLTGIVSRGRMGRFDDAVALATLTSTPADIAAVRRYQGRPGVSFNLEQEIAPKVGLFLRAGWADGRFESYEFTDVDRTVSGGISVSGSRWGRDGDTFALAAGVNGASRERERFLNAGGLGILIGDGKLPRPGSEALVEGYYDLQLTTPAHLSFDLQLVDNPGYNRDRGPVAIGAMRLHAQF
ncbi:MAG: carbohydrate porin [Proteobacteria bacterium]|nr:carbohydrate porin [Pseudomonadota bacterium]